MAICRIGDTEGQRGQTGVPSALCVAVFVVMEKPQYVFRGSCVFRHSSGPLPTRVFATS